MRKSEKWKQILDDSGWQKERMYSKERERMRHILNESVEMKNREERPINNLDLNL